MTELTKEKIAELRRLLEKATIGEWSVERHDHNDGEISYEIWELGARDMRFVCRFEEDSDDRGDASRKANFLLAMRNALPTLLDLAERGIKCGQPDNPRGGDAHVSADEPVPRPDATSPGVTAGASAGEDEELCKRLDDTAWSMDYNDRGG